MNNQLEYANEGLAAWKFNETVFAQYWTQNRMCTNNINGQNSDASTHRD